MRRLRRHVDNRLMRRVRRDDAVCGQGLAADRNRRTHPGFTPALAYAYLTQIYDIVLELLGFGRSFKTRIARPVAAVLLRIVSIFDGRENMRANLAGELPALLASTGFTVQEVARPHRSVQYLLATAGGEGCPDVGGGPGTGGHCSLVVGRFASGSFVP